MSCEQTSISLYNICDHLGPSDQTSAKRTGAGRNRARLPPDRENRPDGYGCVLSFTDLNENKDFCVLKTQGALIGYQPYW